MGRTKPLAKQTRYLLGRDVAADRRRTREMYYRWQERDLRAELVTYEAILAHYDSGQFADVGWPQGMGRTFYLIRIRMIKNELHMREIRPLWRPAASRDRISS